ncbi:uncharacterized protein LOC125504668 isoform X1 [Dendroctonus ponderosae]|uniref:uncharacterized protein LOC109539615 isoform X1 n=1 Tax=Dendroctonus ponderosae TaxID=77166 RepID=UPI00203545A1|nr:uncharacterized protein LOC109539615 isoform X1 [Dendroctonus ponderosae]XP_048522993.1 uncharacterized protein LOC125504668 isoform X1 [Dendroctonus ponderosae]
MVSRILVSAPAPIPITLPQSWKLGAFNRKTLGRTSKNQLRNYSKFSRSSCPPKPDAKKCPQPIEDVCEPPNEKSGKRETGPEVTPCSPECRKGTPNLPPRGCLPWEKGAELCPEKEPTRKLISATCEHLCQPYVGQGIIDKLKVSACEYRRFEKCFIKEKDASQCLELGPNIALSRKIYPMAHAEQKKYLPGCPIKSHHFVRPKTEPEC